MTDKRWSSIGSREGETRAVERMGSEAVVDKMLPRVGGYKGGNNITAQNFSVLKTFGRVIRTLTHQSVGRVPVRLSFTIYCKYCLYT